MGAEVHDHLTERISGARLRLEIRRGARPAIITVFGIALGALCGWYILGHIQGGGLGSTQTLRFRVNDASSIIPGRAETRFEGIRSGVITKVSLTDGQPIVTATFANKFGPIYRDAQLTLRPNTPLQDMFLDVVDRGTKAAGKLTEGAPLAASQTRTAVNVTDALQVFDPDTRAHLATILDQFGGGLSGQGDSLREAVADAAPLLKVATDLTDQLAIRTQKTAELVHNTRLLTGELANRDVALRSLVTDARTTLDALAHNEGGLDGTLRELPPTLSAVDSSFSALRTVLPDLNHAVGDLRPAAAELPDSLSALRTFSAAAKPAVAALHGPVQRLVPLATALRPFSSRLNTAITELRPQIPAVDHITKVAAECPLVPYAFFQWTASILKFRDSFGGYPRGDFVVSLNSASASKDPNQFRGVSCAGGVAKGSEP